jgi:hypothetical protein
LILLDLDNSGKPTLVQFFQTGQFIKFEQDDLQAYASKDVLQTPTDLYDDEAESLFQSHAIKLAKLRDPLSLVIKSLESNSVQNLPLI